SRTETDKVAESLCSTRFYCEFSRHKFGSQCQARTISLRRLNLKHVPGDNNFFGGPVDKRKQIFDPLNVFFRTVKNKY
ncbi:hypothetical protein, partial [Escherichia coli]|uniref:hypothetical protein n=1 Tax=Escherichia coli TaxID=562 RepID=UPI001BE5101D